MVGYPDNKEAEIVTPTTLNPLKTLNGLQIDHSLFSVLKSDSEKLGFGCKKDGRLGFTKLTFDITSDLGFRKRGTDKK